MEPRLSKAWVGIMLATGLLASGPTLHAGEHGTHHDVRMKGGPDAGAQTLGELWHAVRVHEDELGNLIRAKELGKVHEVAFAIRDLVARMPEMSGQLSVEQQAKLKGDVKYVATLAGRLDAAGDAKNQDATETSFKQLRSVLGAIEELYLPDALK